MTDPLPPLPDLPISGLTPQRLDQETVDRLLTINYERRPDLFTRMAERDRTQIGHPSDEFCQDFFRFVQEDLGVHDMRMIDLFWEVRRRARLMHGMPI